jgi:hypothetical protein
LLECFGIAFRGDIVGHIGRDLLIGPLNSSSSQLRGTAINVLGRWLEYDEDGMWLDLAEEQLERERERNTELYQKLWSFVSWFHDEHDDVQELEPDSDYENWLEVRRSCECEMRGTFPIMQLGPVVARLTGLEPQTLGSVLEYVQFPLDADLEPIMERLEYTHPAIKHLGISWGQVSGGRVLRVCDETGAFAFSVEPTATRGRWLLFAYLR